MPDFKESKLADDNKSFHCQKAVALPQHSYPGYDVLYLDDDFVDEDCLSDEDVELNEESYLHSDAYHYSYDSSSHRDLYHRCDSMNLKDMHLKHDSSNHKDVHHRHDISRRNIHHKHNSVSRRDRHQCHESSSSEKIVPANTTDEQTHSVFVDAFIQNHRLDHVSQVMGYHPNYLRNFHTTQNYLLREDGPLPLDYRHYIAIIASARHHCTYLVRLHEQEFLLHNGNPEWMKGIQHAPRKIQELYEINKLLAHQPWLITKDHIAKLLRSPEPWSLSELMHAIILLTHFHSMCSFVYGCGVSAEVDIGGFTYGGTESDADSCSDSSSETGDTLDNIHSKALKDEAGVGLEVLMERMRKLTETSVEDMSAEELLKRFHSVEHQSAEITVPSTKKSIPKSEILRYVIDADFTYTDFATRDSVSEVPTFRACDYSWDDHGFSLANRLYTDIGNLLDDKYNMAANMTYYTMGDNHEVDTSSFRRAIWNYIHCMYGIRHDDYDYSQVNQMLERNLKAYIKTLTCYPERLQKKDYDSVMREFKHSEKVHVNLMLMEARQQAELLYALRAVNRYIT